MIEPGEFFFFGVSDPSACIEGRFSAEWIDKELGIQGLYGFPRGKPATRTLIALIFFRVKGWSKEKVEQWIGEHSSYLPKFELREGKMKIRSSGLGLYTFGSKLGVIIGTAKIGEAKITGKEKILHAPPRRDGWLTDYVERMQERERQREALRQRAKRIMEIKEEVRRENLRMQQRKGGHPP